MHVIGKPKAGRISLSVFLFAGLLAILCGCGGRSSSHLDRALQDQLGAALPQPSGLKAFAGITPQSLLGTATFQSSSGALGEIAPPFAVPSALRLDSTDGGHFEWAIYSVNPANPLSGAFVTLDNLDLGDEAFLGVADFERNAWQFSGPHTSASDTSTPEPETGVYSVPLDEQVNRNSGGAIFIAVVSPVGSNFRVFGLSINSISPDAPVADIQADVTSGDTPLTVNMDASGSTDADGTIVKYEWDSNGDGVFESNTGAVPNSSNNYTAGGIFEPAVRVTDDDGLTATASFELTVTVNGNIPPTALLEPDTLEGDGELGFDVNFVSSGSNDPDGSIALYEWDLDGDATTGSGGYELSSSSPDLQQVTYSEPGENKVRLRVTDDGGLQDTAQVKIVSHGWVVVDTGAGPGGSSGLSLAQIGKFPAIALTTSVQALRYAVSSSSFGTDAADWSSVDLLPSGCSVNCLAQVSGKPAITVRENGLKYLRHASGNALVAANWQVVSVDMTPSSDSSLLVVDGNPAVAYQANGSFNDLRYARSSTPTGAGPGDWSVITVDDEEPFTGQRCSLAIVDGRPAISYVYQGAENALRYALSDSSTGSNAADWNIVNLLPGETIRLSTSLAVVNGVPCIAFRESVLETLRFAFASSADGASVDDWQAIVVDPTLINGQTGSLAVVAGAPHILYSGNLSGGIVLASSTTPSGTVDTDWVLDESGITGGTDGSLVDLAEVNGYPAVLFTGTGLKVMYGIHF